MQGIVDQVNNRDADIDLAVFLGTNHIKLMKMLNNKTNIFKIPYTTLISKAEMGNIDLRLDTNVVSIDEFRDTYLPSRNIPTHNNMIIFKITS